MTANGYALGEPTHYARCMLCRKKVGGPYFAQGEAHERLKEHVVNCHDSHPMYLRWASEAPIPKEVRVTTKRPGGAILPKRRPVRGTFTR